MSFNAYMHERNIYKTQPDFAKIALDFPEFRKYAIPDAKGQKVRVDFTNTEALRMLTKILLKKDFNLEIEIPEGFLIPTVPQRLNYILWIEDLLSTISPRVEFASGIDIGTGPCAIFSILGAQKNGWKFVATESSEDAIIWAKKNIQKNNLVDKIQVSKVNEGSTLDEILSSNQECYDFCLCNPPFFENIEEIRKKHHNSSETIADVAQKQEIFVKGGELEFVKSILKDSVKYKNRVCLFTSMFGKKKNFLQILKEIEDIKEAKFTKTEFCQGNTIRWGIAWTFSKSVQFTHEVKKRIKPKKAKPPLEYQILMKNSKKFQLDTTVKQAATFLKSLEIHVTHVRLSQNFAELMLKSDKNTWTHQRRKRRECERQKKEQNNTEQSLAASSSSEITQAPLKCDNSNVNPSISASPKKINFDLENHYATENPHICIKKEEIDKDSSDTQLVNQGNEKINTGDNIHSESDIMKLESQSSELSMSCNNKRKEGFSSEDLPTCKRTRIDTNEKTIINKLPDNSDNFCLKTEAVTKSCKLVTQNIHSENHIATHTIDYENISVKLESQSSIADSSNDVSMHTDVPVQNSSSSTSKNICTSEFSPIKSEIHSTEDRDAVVDKAGSKNILDAVRDETKDISPVEGSVLHCYLQFIKGKSKIYVKMNCPLTADRNTMYQVFQLIKNKIN